MAVELKELRLGNWILPNNEKIWIPEYNKKPVIVDEDIMVYYLILEQIGSRMDFDYIELTPKILNNFGFISSANKGTYYNSTKTDFRLRFKSNGLHLVFAGQDTISSIGIEIKFIHQLQNLFHSLTGIELNDIVAYNYYIKIWSENSTGSNFNFDEFLKEKEISTMTGVSGYSLGDLPPNLFQ